MKPFWKTPKYVMWKYRNYLTLVVIQNLIILAALLSAYFASL